MAETPKAERDRPARAEKAATEEATRLSSDARFSTYREATADELDNADEVLPPGRHTMQEKGEADEGAEPGFKFANK